MLTEMLGRVYTMPNVKTSEAIEAGGGNVMYKKFDRLMDAVLWYMYKGCDKDASVKPISLDIRSMITGVEQQRDDPGEYLYHT